MPKRSRKSAGIAAHLAGVGVALQVPGEVLAQPRAVHQLKADGALGRQAAQGGDVVDHRAHGVLVQLPPAHHARRAAHHRQRHDAADPTHEGNPNPSRPGRCYLPGP